MKMGEIRAVLILRNQTDMILRKHRKTAKDRVRTVTIEAVVDTGAVMMLLPREVVQRLGLKIIGRTTARLADERVVGFDVAGNFELSIAGRTWTTDCLVGPPGCDALIGQLVLERLDLILDPASRTVQPRAPRMTLKMKQAVAA